MEDKWRKLKDEIYRKDIIGYSDQIESALDYALASQLEEVVELSDRIELEGNTTLEEWKAFKRFRNLLRKRKELKGVR